MKISHLIVLLILSVSVNLYGQKDRVRGMETKSDAIPVIVNSENKGTIVFKGASGTPDTFFGDHQSFTSYIYTFASPEEARQFAEKFKNSDPNVASCSYANREAGGYYEFTFSVIEKQNVKWFLNLFKKNNLGFIKFDKGPKSIDKLLEK